MAELDSVAKPDDLCTVTRLDNGIYHFFIGASSRAAADAFLAHVEVLFRDNQNGPTLRLLYEFSNQVFPLNYAIPRVSQIMKKYPNRPNTRSAAMLEGGIISLATGLFNLIRVPGKDTFRLFKLAGREAAIEWLLADD